ncbi:hypothetical protein HHL22_08520 [Hymenobacter sp. RP-2-7]|uniref:Uncharacterized protein n=1 Tax=Hymenobacter polaris TaxID=2682546 RepID=A0A7Y0ADC1_9BACT|nr:hypothetical protein [Hymenobacter polaris]NML65245.1 hypothetical protein [Hymenobacter polaris]
MKIFLLLLALAAATLGTARAQSAGSPTGSAPNYKPAPGTKSPAKTGGKPADGAAGKVVVSSGGQGHNSGPDPKGKILVAPSTTSGQPGKPSAAKKAAARKQ